MQLQHRGTRNFAYLTLECIYLDCAFIESCTKHSIIPAGCWCGAGNETETRSKGFIPMPDVLTFSSGFVQTGTPRAFGLRKGGRF
jgi:hypothetical protein